MKKTLLLFIIMGVIISIIPVTHSFSQETEPIVKVKLVNFLGNTSEITLKPNGDYYTNDGKVVLKDGVTYSLKQVNGKLSLYKSGNLLSTSQTFSAQPITSKSQLSINNRPYLGSFDFIVENNQYVRPINSVYLEDYLKGVVPSEMYPSWNVEALKTQAVAARTYAMSYLNRGIINDTISYQAYGGYVWTPNSTKAVDETKGQVLHYNGRLIDAVYSASNGGITESNANAWGNAQVPYLTIKQDEYDPKTAWNFTFNKTQIDLTTKDLAKPSEWWSSTKEVDTTIIYNIKSWLTNNGYPNKELKITSIPTLSLDGKGSGGRVSKGSITVNFLVKDMVDSNGKLIPQQVSFSGVNASRIRAMVGNRVMLSYLVEEVTTDSNKIVVKGRGDGHGVGMSQWGAKYMADTGKNYEEILKFYYTGVSIVKVYEASLKEHSPLTIEPVKQPIKVALNQMATSYKKMKDEVILIYSLNDTAKVSLYVKDSKGNVIDSLQKEVSKSQGDYSTIWNTSNVSNGTYTFVLEAEDLEGNSSTIEDTIWLNKKMTGKISSSNVDIREKATANSNSLGKLQKANTVTVLSEKGTWLYIQYGKIKGYVPAKFIRHIN